MGNGGSLYSELGCFGSSSFSTTRITAPIVWDNLKVLPPFPKMLRGDLFSWTETLNSIVMHLVLCDLLTCCIAQMLSNIYNYF